MDSTTMDGRVAAGRRLGAGICLLVLVAGAVGAAVTLLSRWSGAGVGAGVTVADGDVLRSLTGASRLDRLLADVAALGLVLVLLATAVSTLASVLVAVRARARPGVRRSATLERSLAPPLVRRLVATAVGVGALTAAGATAATASPADAPSAAAPMVPAWPAAGTSAGLDGTDRADRAGGAAPLAAPGVGRSRDAPRASVPPGEPAVQHGSDVVVTSGDTLWDIAAAHLPRGAPPEAVAAQWPRWWSANRAVIGDDPDLIVPGQRLHEPAGGAS